MHDDKISEALSLVRLALNLPKSPTQQVYLRSASEALVLARIAAVKGNALLVARHLHTAQCDLRVAQAWGGR